MVTKKGFQILLMLVISLHFLAAKGQALFPKYEFRGVWVATVNNIDWPSKPGLSMEAMQKEVTEMLDLHQKLGMNVIIFQVRPCSDAFYISEIEPWSRYLTGSPGRQPTPLWDPLKFWIEESHKRGMELHAWMNPYRVAQNSEEVLAGNHQIFNKPEWAIKYENKLLFDPGIPETRTYVTKVVCDVTRRYDIDGIHFDDYFYPYPGKEAFPDQKSFLRYNRAFPASEKEAWRRENVDILIQMISDSIKSIKPWVKFGISPFGVWRNKKTDPLGSDTNAGITNYDHLYADIRKWLQLGWIDYVVPQVYWEIGHRTVDFDAICRWWNANSFGRGLVVGQAPYKLEKQSPVVAWRSPSQLPKQIEVVRKYTNISGSAYFSSKQFKRNLMGFQDSLRHKYYRLPALTPPMPWLNFAAPNSPGKVRVSGKRVIWDPPAPTSPIAAPVRYLIYMNETGKPFVQGSSAFIIQYTALTAIEFTRKSKKRKNYEIRVTTLDRLNNESQPSEPVTIKL